MASPTRIGDEVILNLSGKILPSEIRKQLSGLAAKYTPASADEGWYYKLTNITTTSGALISNSPYLSKGANTRGSDTETSAAIASPVDKVKFLIIIHTGWNETGTVENEDSIYLTISGSAPAYNGTDSIEIGYKEAWYAKMNNATVADFYAITGVAAGASGGTAKAQCVVAAILEDV